MRLGSGESAERGSWSDTSDGTSIDQAAGVQTAEGSANHASILGPILLQLGSGYAGGIPSGARYGAAGAVQAHGVDQNESQHCSIVGGEDPEAAFRQLGHDLVVVAGEPVPSGRFDQYAAGIAGESREVGAKRRVGQTWIVALGHGVECGLNGGPRRPDVVAAAFVESVEGHSMPPLVDARRG